MFHVGQRVVCIADYQGIAALEWATLLNITFPELNGIYTVRKLVQRVVGGDTAYGLLLHEVHNEPCRFDRAGQGGILDPADKRLSTEREEVAFSATDFRPLITVEDFALANERLSEPA